MPGLGLCDGFLLVSDLAPTEAEALDGIGPRAAGTPAEVRADDSRCRA